MDAEERWTRDLRYYRLARHMVTVHGTEGPPPGTPNRRHRMETEHDHIHDTEGAGHPKEAL